MQLILCAILIAWEFQYAVSFYKTCPLSTFSPFFSFCRNKPEAVDVTFAGEIQLRVLLLSSTSL